MAVNQNVNKVVYGNNTLIDLTNDTVEPSAMVEGYTAHDRSGAPIQGTLEVYTKSEIDDLLDEKQDVLTFDTTPTNGSQNPVTSDGVYDAIGQATAKTDWVNSSLSGIKCRKRAGFVQVYFNVGVPLTSAYENIATLPNGYIPDVTVYTVCVGSMGIGIVYVIISSDGVIRARVDSGTGTAINGLVTF